MKLNRQQLLNVKYEFLLVSLLLVLFGPAFIPPFLMPIVRPIFLLLTFVSGLLLFDDHKVWRGILLTLFFLTLGIEIYHAVYEISSNRAFLNLVYIVFFLSVSLRTYRTIYKAKTINQSVIVAVFCGFILLCLIATLLFTIIENGHPGSFSNLGEPDTRFNNITYFSFITCLTIGYGDIVPLTVQAKQAVIFIALIGNFYSVFVMGIIIGKFLGQQQQ